MTDTHHALPDEEGDVDDDVETEENSQTHSGHLCQAAAGDGVTLCHQQQHQQKDRCAGS